MLKVTRGETVARQTTLQIEVEPERVDQHLQKAYQRLVQRTRVPGFRQGKAPRPILERYVGREHLLEEALESLVPEAVGEAVKAESLQPAATPRVSIVERQPVVKLEATIALEPAVVLGDYTSVRIVRDEEAVKDEDVEKALERVRDANGTWTPVERVLRLGDLATVTATGQSDGKQVLNAQSTEFLAVEGSTYPVKGFAEALAGMAPEESREFSLTFPADYSQKDLQGKGAQFKVTLHSLKEKVLPALDDELAKTVGEGLQTLAELRNRVRQNIEAQAVEDARRSVERQVLDALVAGATFELPPIVVEHEADHILYDQQQALARYKVPIEAYVRSVGKDAGQFVQEARTSAEDRLKRSLVIEKLAESEGITVSEEQVTSEVEALKASEPDRKGLDSEEVRVAVRRALRRKAAMDRAFEIAGQGHLATRATVQN